MAIHITTLKNEFYWDDRPQILQGKLLHELDAIPKMFQHEVWYNVDMGERAPGTQVDIYRPLFNLSLFIDYQIWGKQSAGFHLTNLLIHLANTLLLYLLFLHLLPSRFAWLGSALFALFPLCAEPIHYASARSESITALFLFLSLFFGLQSKQQLKWRDLWMALAFLLALLTKETAILLPIFLLAVFLTREHQTTTDSWFKPMCWLAGSLMVYAVLRLQALGGAKGLEDSSHALELILNFPSYVLLWLSCFLIPINNMPMQHFAAVHTLTDWGAWIKAVFLYSAFAAILFGCLKKRWAAGYGWLWILLLLLPSAIGSTLNEVFNPRYGYAAVAGGVLILTIALKQLSNMPKLRIFGNILTIVLFCFYAITSIRVGAAYRTEVSFYQNILEQRPGYTEAEYNLANTLYRQKSKQEAITIYRHILNKEPNHLMAMNNLAVALLDLGKPEAARQLLDKLIVLDDSKPRYFYNHALALKGIGEDEKSIAALLRAYKLDRNYLPARRVLQYLCKKQHDHIPKKVCVDSK